MQNNRKDERSMKKIYETPVCQTIHTAEEDILTTSPFKLFVNGGADGDISDGGAVITW